MGRLLLVLRALRYHVPGLHVIHRVAREPYYRFLEWARSRGISTRLSSGLQVRLHQVSWYAGRGV
jgi:hypothetical protein